MRRRILLSTLLVVAITALALGGPLVVATWQLVEDFTRAELTQRLEQLTESLEDSDGRVPDRASIELAIPSNSRLVIDQVDQAPQVYGVSEVPDPVVESLPFGPGGTITLAQPRSVMRGQQTQVVAVVALLVIISVTSGRSSRRSPPAGWPSRCATWRPAPPGWAPATSAARPPGTTSPSWTASPRCWTRRRRPWRSSCSASACSSGTCRTSCGAGSPRCSCASTSCPPTRTRTPAARRSRRSSRPSASPRSSTSCWRRPAPRAAGAEPTDVKEAMEEVAAEWRAGFASAGRSLRVRVPEGMLARVTAARVREAVGALVENALRHGDGPATITARPGENALLLEVSDTGPGVPEELVPHVFERGVSAQSSTGLGLALARALVEADGGRLELSRARPPTFRLYLPAARADDVVGSAHQASGPR